MGGSARRQSFAASASNLSPVTIDSGTYDAGSGEVYLQCSGLLTYSEGTPGSAWFVRFGSHVRVVTSVIASSDGITLQTYSEDLELDGPVAVYSGPAGGILDADGLALGAQGPVVLTPA